MNRPRLVIVDDDLMVLEALSELLARSCEVSSFSSPLQALEHIQADPPDVVLSDQIMPELTGDQLLREVGRRWPHVGRVLITGFSDLTSLIRAVNEGGIRHVLAKPWDNQEVVAVVLDAARQSGANSVP